MKKSSDTLLNIQKRVIWALLMSEIVIRFGRHNIGFLWLIVEPVMFTLGITALWSFAHLAHSSTLPITAFALTGYSSVLLWRNSVTRCNRAIRANRNLLHHRYIKVIHLLLARVILEISSVSMSFLLLSIAFVATGLIDFPDNLLLIFAGFGLLSWFSMALALLIGAITEQYEAVERVWHTISYLLFPLSGAAFMVDWLPSSAQHFILFLPMVHGVEMIRHGFFGTSVLTYYSVFYLFCFSAVLSLFALAWVKKASKHVGSE